MIFMLYFYLFYFFTYRWVGIFSHTYKYTTVREIAFFSSVTFGFCSASQYLKTSHRWKHFNTSFDFAKMTAISDKLTAVQSDSGDSTSAFL